MSSSATIITCTDLPHPRSCQDLLRIAPVDPMHLDCPVIGRERVIYVQRGQRAVIWWPLRDRQGHPVPLALCPLGDGSSSSSSSSMSADNSNRQYVVRIHDALGDSPVIYQVLATNRSTELEDGCAVLEWTLPTKVADDPGIFRFEVAIVEGDGLIWSNTGLLSVERGLFGNVRSTGTDGPPSLGEIRTYLRDTLAENTLWKELEYPDVDIIHAMLRPVEQWNETPPDVGRFNGRNFPWRYHWIRAIVAELLFSVALWYERNRLPAQHGGITVDPRARFQSYMTVAQSLRQEWKEFMMFQKAVINARQMMGSVGSAYGRFAW